MIGQTVSHYKILELLGGGGMGIVFKAHDLKLDRPVALKFLPPDLTRDPDAKQRFIREAKAASALQHNNICVIYDIDETDDGTMFISMEYLEGVSLREKIARGPLTPCEAADIAIQVAEGLSKAHEHGIIHRDIKPANIMVTTEGAAKIVDFGLAKLSGQTMLTRSGSTVGTAAYMSPEQVRGETVDERADIWALGVVLYEMLSGRHPFQSEIADAVYYRILNESPPSIATLCPELPDGASRTVARALAKNRDERYRTAREFAQDLIAHLAPDRIPIEPAGIRTILRKPAVLMAAITVLVAIGAGTFWLLQGAASERRAREVLLPEIERLVNEYETSKAFALALEAEKIIPTDPQLRTLLRSVERILVAHTTPPGAHLYVRDYRDSSETWIDLGVTPLKGVRISQAFMRWRIVKEGFEPVEGTDDKELKNAWDTLSIQITLDTVGALPPGMVRIRQQAAGGRDYFVDRYEVSNADYRTFVAQGGYRRKEFWKLPIAWDGATLSWEEAMKRFTDRTGRPGPSTWEYGDAPEGSDSLPVGGISWYEAMAYAEFTGKMLPTRNHWYGALGEWNGEFLLPAGNFSGRGPRPITSSRSLSPEGTYDMAGNVKEWLWNKSGSGRAVCGGSWSSDPYMIYEPESLPPNTRQPDIGFRCMMTADGQPPRPRSLEPIESGGGAFVARPPCSDAVFEIYRNFFRYTKKDLAAKVEWRVESEPAWISEKITVNAAYGGERLPLYVWTPRNVTPPFQTVIYFPGASAFFSFSSVDQWPGRTREIFVKSGRALVLPVYKGSFERRYSPPGYGDTPEEWRDRLVQMSKDMGRALDWLETRPEFDMRKVAFAGSSQGAYYAPFLVAVEPRIQAAVWIAGGLNSSPPPLPEMDHVNYAPRIKIPVIMLNGRYDHIFGLEASQKPLFRLLGTPAGKKEHVIFDTGHDMLANPKHVQAYLDFLDRTFGPTH